MCVIDHHDMTLAVKVALNPNLTNQPTIGQEMGLMAQWPILYEQNLTNKVCNKETNEQMHCRNTRTGQNTNRERPDEGAIPFPMS